MKILFFILLLSLALLKVNAQADTSNFYEEEDTVTKKIPVTAVAKKKRNADSIPKHVAADTLKTSEAILQDSNGSKLTNDSVKNGLLDSIESPVALSKVKLPIDPFYLKMLDNPFLRTNAQPVLLLISEKQRTQKDDIFYLAAALLFLLACIKLVFGNYFSNLFRLFFQPAYRQKQTREQLQQNNLPSLLLNFFFILSTGAYISFLLQSGNNAESFFRVFIYSSICLLLVYLGKYIFLQFSGWVFNVREAAEAYIFAVYLINKITGVLLIPFILIMAFSQPALLRISIPVSAMMITVLFVYRYLVSYTPIRRQVKVNAIHFVLFVCAVEIIPLLLIYKTLNSLLGNTL